MQKSQSDRVLPNRSVNLAHWSAKLAELRRSRCYELVVFVPAMLPYLAQFDPTIDHSVSITASPILLVQPPSLLDRRSKKSLVIGVGHCLLRSSVAMPQCVPHQMRVFSRHCTLVAGPVLHNIHSLQARLLCRPSMEMVAIGAIY